MWSDKHNTHHAATNVMGLDEDLSGGPLLWLWAPDPSRDKLWRRWQNIYCGALFSLLHVVWRVDSAVVAYRRGIRDELLALVVHYAVFGAVFGLGTNIAATLFAGLLMANITSATHQSEDLLTAAPDCWVSAQLATTRDAVCRNRFHGWVWGGMQWQAEHHLFPTLPRYKLAKVAPLVEAFAARNGLDYRRSDEFDLLLGNYRNYARVAGEAAVVGAPASRGGVTI